ncbi:MAG: hypothetical protein IPK71_28385 [Myxococcales bacterium]|nr:hypothetical protein [Myxococcales bacterium]
MKAMRHFVGWVAPLSLVGLSLVPRLARAEEPPPATAPAVVNVPAVEATPPETKTPQAPPSPRASTPEPNESESPSGPARMRWDDDRAAPAGYHLEGGVRSGLVIGGAVTFGSLYLLTALTAAALDDTNRERNAGALYVPVAGPFLHLKDASSDTAKLVLVVDGLAQAAGAAMLVVGLTAPRTFAVRNDAAKIAITPVLGPGRAGLVGTF